MLKAALAAAALLATGPGAIPAAFAEAHLAGWAKSMTSDPATNHALERYTRPLPDRNQTVIRTIVLFQLLSTSCVGVKPDQRKLDGYAEASGLLTASTEDAKMASRFAAAEFDDLDYDSLTHLCAGSDHLFGPRGMLLKGAMSKGSGKVKFPDDPANPYLPVRPFLPE